MDEKVIPLVSVVMITYGHESFIAEAVNSILIQEAIFKVELIIADDASPDNTSHVIQNLIAQNTTSISIKYIRRSTNFGMIHNLIDAIGQAKGKYIAMCEGDDYWTDSTKLQKQVDFLEKNTDFVFCTHRYQVYNDFDKTFINIIQPAHFKPYNLKLKGVVVNKKTFHNNWLTQPLTCLIEKSKWNEVIKESNRFKYFRDFHFFYLLLNYGDGLCMDLVAGVYRMHQNGVYNSMNNVQKYKTASLIYQELYEYSKDSRFFQAYWNAIFILLKNKQPVKTLFIPFISSLTFTEKFWASTSFLKFTLSFVTRKLKLVSKIL